MTETLYAFADLRKTDIAFEREVSLLEGELKRQRKASGPIELRQEVTRAILTRELVLTSRRKRLDFWTLLATSPFLEVVSWDYIDDRLVAVFRLWPLVLHDDAVSHFNQYEPQPQEAEPPWPYVIIL